jgi:outer membrane lipoprotein-sorting protein
MRRLELLPLDPSGSDFSSVRIGFVDGVPVMLELIDSLNQLMQVTLQGIVVDSGLAAEAFIFDAPPGVTVIGADD